MYCVICKKHTNTTDVKLFTSKNRRLMQRGICAVCGKVKTQFIKSGAGLFNKAVSKLLFELHLPGHNCTGPDTRLNRKLNPNLTPKEWSKRTNRVDTAAYIPSRLMLCETSRHTNLSIYLSIQTRNDVCDRNMVRKLDMISNPTLRERLERGLVSNLINTKVNFGLELKKPRRYQ